VHWLVVAMLVFLRIRMFVCAPHCLHMLAIASWLAWVLHAWCALIVAGEWWWHVGVLAWLVGGCLVGLMCFSSAFAGVPLLLTFDCFW